MAKPGSKSKFFNACLRMFTGIVLVAVCMTGTSACAKRDVKEKKHLEQMADADLLSYYHGINDRIKDIESQYKTDRDVAPVQFEHESLFAQAVDGKIYKLEHKRQLILKELEKRDIHP